MKCLYNIFKSERNIVLYQTIFIILQLGQKYLLNNLISHLDMVLLIMKANDLDILSSISYQDYFFSCSKRGVKRRNLQYSQLYTIDYLYFHLFIHLLWFHELMYDRKKLWRSMSPLYKIKQ